jgi:hypothetical protein
VRVAFTLPVQVQVREQIQARVVVELADNRVIPSAVQAVVKEHSSIKS